MAALHTRTARASAESARFIPGFCATLDLQHATNSAYNRDRGPVWLASLRLHVEAAKK